MKKFFALFLTLVLCVAFAVPVLAADSDVTSAEVNATCNHTYGSSITTVTYVAISSSQCEKRTIVTRVCTKCAYVDQQTTATERVYHAPGVKSASCDGTTQTWKYYCENCGMHCYDSWVTCPRGPHSGPCPALPV